MGGHLHRPSWVERGGERGRGETEQEERQQIRLIIITTAAVSVEQEHGGSRRPAITDPDSTAPEAEIPAESEKAKKHRKHKDYQEEMELVACISGIGMRTDREGEEEREAQCVIGNPPAV
ncbi:hypothetical protein DVA81_17765 [Acinetobacter baumannii]|nr:hypothetical protein DVA81_17765 [Acinetobacter baumannii]